MEIEASQVVFVILSVVIAICSILTVTSRNLLRSATYLLLVLISTAGLYLLLNYHFLAAVQLSVYVGGIMVLFVFSIFLTSQVGEKMENPSKDKLLWGILASVGGSLLSGFIILQYPFQPIFQSDLQEVNMVKIGTSLIGTDRFQYLLPFEIISVLLLACIIGSVVIARKNKEDK